MSRRVRIDFWDFPQAFDRHNNFFAWLLRSNFDVEIADDPEFVIYSCFGKRHRSFRGIRIFYTGECRRPDFCVSDYVFSFDYLDHPDHYRLPYYVTTIPPDKLTLPRQSPEEILAAKTGFCSFVFSNPRCLQRNRLFHKLSQYKQVDSGGRFLNNVGGPVADKLQFQRRYKFAIAYENSAYPGYTTEKLPEAVWARTIPIYWGNPLVHREFNPARFLHRDNFASDEALIERIAEIDNDDALYLEYLRQPLFYDNRPNACYDLPRLVAQFDRIFAASKPPVARSWPRYMAFQSKRLGRSFRRLLLKAA